MDVSALKHLAERRAERDADGSPETLSDIIQRTRYSAEWKLNQAERSRREAEGFRKLSTVEGYTLQQREDARVAAGSCLQKAFADEDASRILDSIADALVYLVG